MKALTEIARKHGVQVFTVELDDLDLTSATGDFRLTTLGLFDDYEKERTRPEETVRKSQE